MTDHVLVIHRWRDGYARYADYLDHRIRRVCYVTTAMGAASVPPDATEVVLVDTTEDVTAVRAAAEALIARHGPPERLVALNEGDLDVAAELRLELGIPGQDPAQLARYRDKLEMNRIVAGAGISTPAFADAPDAAAVEDFAREHGWPVLTKPRRGTASRGVLLLRSPADLPLLAALAPEPRLIQSFCPDQIYHVDGVWIGSELGPWRASRYLNNCVDFTQGLALGSVEEDDPGVLGPLGEFTAAVAGALNDQPWVFHLEVFVGGAADGLRLSFLEVGYRAGGAEIPFVWREVHGVDLMAAAIDVQLGRRPQNQVLGADRVGGWLLVPTPVPAPCRVVAAELAAPPADRPYAQVVPPIGYRIPKAGGYEHVGARFRFRGASTDEVERAITVTARQFRLDCVVESE